MPKYAKIRRRYRFYMSACKVVLAFRLAKRLLVYSSTVYRRRFRHFADRIQRQPKRQVLQGGSILMFLFSTRRQASPRADGKPPASEGSTRKDGKTCGGIDGSGSGIDESGRNLGRNKQIETAFLWIAFSGFRR